MSLVIETLFQSPGPQPNGMQATAEGLWILDQGSNEVHLVSYAGEVLRGFPTASDRGSGITDDGIHLWIASTYSCEILKVDRKTGATLAAFATPGAGVTGAHGLEWRAGELWMAVPPSATIARTASPGKATTSGVRRRATAPSIASIRGTARSPTRSKSPPPTPSRTA
jgi:hypothetical protein